MIVVQTFPKHVVGFLCSGRVTRGEYDAILIPAVERALETERKVRLYYETSADFVIDLGAVWEDFKLGVEHLRRWERIGVVTDVDWLSHTIPVFSFLMPARIKVFPGAEVELARAWIIAERSN